MVGIIMETAGLRFPFYVKVHRYTYEKGAWTGVLECKKHLVDPEYLTIWPSWALPIQTQPFSHAVFVWGLCTAVEAMVSEVSDAHPGRIHRVHQQRALPQPGHARVVGHGDPGAQAGWLVGQHLRKMLRTPIYVKRTNPFLDASPVAIRTVRMETCAQVIRDVTRAYGVDTSMDLWLPGDPQPDKWAKLSQPTYVFSTRTAARSPARRKQSRMRSSAPWSTSAGHSASWAHSSAKSRASMECSRPRSSASTSSRRGRSWSPRTAATTARSSAPRSPTTPPRAGSTSSEDDRPKWVGAPVNHRGHRPTGLTLTERSDERNVFLDAGQPPDHPRFTGVPSDLLSGFLNNAFLAFELVQLYSRRDEMGPYHPPSSSSMQPRRPRTT